MANAISKLDDPVFRQERARNAALARGTADYHLRKLAESAAELTPEQLGRLADIVRPALGSVVEQREARAA